MLKVLHVVPRIKMCLHTRVEGPLVIHLLYMQIDNASAQRASHHALILIGRYVCVVDVKPGSEPL